MIAKSTNAFLGSNILRMYFLYTVTNLNVEPVSSTSLELSWEAPAVTCTVNVEYDIEYRLTNRDQCQPSDSGEDKIESVLETNTTLADLHPYSSYEIKVSASGGLQTAYAMTDEAGGLLPFQINFYIISFD